MLEQHGACKLFSRLLPIALQLRFQLWIETVEKDMTTVKSIAEATALNNRCYEAM